MKEYCHVVYPVILDDSENEPGMYTVTFPDIDGAITEGYGRKEAGKKAEEVLTLFLEDIPIEQLPTPSLLNEVAIANPDKVVCLVSLDMNIYDLMERDATFWPKGVPPLYPKHSHRSTEEQYEHAKAAMRRRRTPKSLTDIVPPAFDHERYWKEREQKHRDQSKEIDWGRDVGREIW